MRALSERYRDQLYEQNASANVLRLAEHLFEQPVITIARASQVLGVTAAAGTKIIDRLMGAGVLQEITGWQRGRVYRAEKIMEIIEGDSPEQRVLPLR